MQRVEMISVASVALLVAPLAQAVPAPSVSVTVEATVPLGGVVTGYVQCFPSCTLPTPAFSALDGTPVPGSFAEEPSAGGHFVFVPEPPLEAGTYSASVTGQLNTATASFTVADVPFELPTFSSYVLAETVSEGDLVQCVEQDAALSAMWFTEQTRVRPRLTVSFSGPYLSQYRYSVALADETPTPYSGTSVSKSFDVEGDELCFDVFGFSYQDDSIAELGHECVSLAGLDVGVKEERSGDFRGTLLGCVVPPTGYESDWCAVFEPAFTSGSCDAFALDACFAARNACPDGDDPSDAEEQEERDARAAAATGGASGSGGTASGGSGFVSGGTGQGASLSTGGTTVGTGAAPGSGGSGTGSAGSGDAQACALVRAPSGGKNAWVLLSLPWLIGFSRRRQLSRP